MQHEYGFGRLFAPDARDRRFTLGPALASALEFFPKGIPEGSRHFFSGAVKNQHNTGTCVAFGTGAKINAAPIMQPLPMSEYDFYRGIVSRDEWRENDHEASAPDSGLQSGTSVRASAKYAQELGLIEEYRWAEDVEQGRAFILIGLGGLVGGFTWKSNMMDTDSEGFVSFTGQTVGGHCIYINGWNDRVKRGGRYVRAARAQNSWGTNWGQQGRFWILEDDLQKMIADDGELCAMLENRLAARRPEDSVGGDPAKR